MGDDWDYAPTMKKIGNEMRHLEVWPLPLWFQTPKGIQKFEIKKHPLGLSLSKKAPFVVKKVNSKSVAVELGIQCGWTLVKAGVEEEACQNMSFDKLMQHLHESTEIL